MKPALAEQGIDLQIVEFTDYVMPNKALDAGDIDANYFQHFPYLENFDAENGTDLVSAAAIHFEPLGVYPGKTCVPSTRWPTARRSPSRTTPPTRRARCCCSRSSATSS